MNQTINWQPEAILTEKIITLANQLGQSPEKIIAEAVEQYLETVNVNDLNDPLIGLFSSSPDHV